MGDPSAPTTMLGPLADAKQLERVLGFIETGKSEAQLVTGGERSGDKGAFVKPTIFKNAGEDSTIYREEIFGPVLVVSTFETEEEAIQKANDTSYGLSGMLDYTPFTPFLCLRITPTSCANVNVSVYLHWKHFPRSPRCFQDQSRNHCRQWSLYTRQQHAVWRVQTEWDWKGAGEGGFVCVFAAKDH
jgi:hypothetical protein